MMMTTHHANPKACLIAISVLGEGPAVATLGRFSSGGVMCLPALGRGAQLKSGTHEQNVKMTSAYITAGRSKLGP